MARPEVLERSGNTRRGREPILTRKGLPVDLDDEQSRYIEAVADGMVIGGLYLPNGNPYPGPKSSSDGQDIHLGDGCEIAGGGNGRYGTNPIIKLYTAISGRYAPFHTKIIAATASEAVHVLDALLETDAGLDIVRHHVDGGGVSGLVFAFCHALGFAFVLRIPDLDGRCLYGFGPGKQYGILQNVMGDRIDADLIRAHWDEILRLMTSLRTRTVTASLVLKRLSSTTRQSGLAQAMRQMGRIERTLFKLDWINDEELRKTTTAELDKGESRNSLVRAANLH